MGLYPVNEDFDTAPLECMDLSRRPGCDFLVVTGFPLTSDDVRRVQAVCEDVDGAYLWSGPHGGVADVVYVCIMGGFRRAHALDRVRGCPNCVQFSKIIGVVLA